MQGSPRIDELRQKFHENPRRYFAPLANEYRKAGDPEQAIAICRAHLAQQPGHMSGHVVYGQALYDARRPDEARTVFEKALELDPDNAIVLRHLGDIARQKGESNEARHWYSKALDVDPQDSHVAAYIAELTEPLVGDTVETAAEVEAATPAETQGDGAEPESTFVISEAVDDPTEAAPPEAPVAEAEVPEETAVAPADDLEVPLAEVSLEPEVVSREDAASDEDLLSETEPVGTEEVAWRKTPRPEDSPFVTRTMAELYAKQGYPEAALDVYRQLAIQHPEDSEIRDRITELSGPAETPAPIPEVVTEPEATVEPIAADAWPEAESGYEPSPAQSEDLNTEIPEETPGFTGRHFTETELSDTGTFDRIDIDSESPFGELAWEPEPFLEGEFPAAALTEDMVTELTPLIEPAVVEEPTATEEPVEEAVPVADAEPIEEPISEARFVDMPVALGELQTSIDEAGMAATSPHEENFPEAAESAFEDAAPVAEAPVAEEVSEPVETEDEAAVAMLEQAAPAFAEDAEEDAAEHAVVAYSPELPRGEDLPHFTPKVPTIREFFTALGARKPPSHAGGQPITARAAIPGDSVAPALEGLPLATDAFASMFGDEPVAEEDTRAAFALSGALSSTGHNPTPTSLRTSPPIPAPAIDEPDAQTQESEEDIRRFREWLDGLADS